MSRNRRQSRFLRRLVFLIIFAAIVGLLWQLLVGSGYFKITRVNVSGDSRGVVTEQLQAQALGKNLIFMPEEDLKKAVSEAYVVEDLKITRDWPATLNVSVSYREPVLSWQSRQGRFLIDETGLAFQTATGEQLPQANDPNSNLVLGERIPAEHVRVTLKLLGALKDKFTVLTLSISGSTVTITLSSGTVVTLPTERDFAEKAQALQLILTQAKIEGRAPRTVDLRFDKPVVTY